MADRLTSGWLWFVSLMAALILLTSFRSFPAVMLWYALPALIAVVLRPEPFSLPAWAWALAALTTYSVISALWTPQGGAAEWIWWQPAFFLVGLGGFIRPAPPVHMLTLGLGLALVLLFIDAVTGSGLRAILPPENRPDKDAIATARGLGLLLMLMPFLVLALVQSTKVWVGVAAVLAMTIGVLVTPVEANILAAMAAVVVGALTWWRPDVGLRAVIGAMGAALASPFVLAITLPSVAVSAQITSLPPSLAHRLIIWRSVLDEWLAGQTLFGAGARATRALGRERGEVMLAGIGREVSVVSVHPHSVPIEILYEYGLIGYACLLLAYAWGAKKLLLLQHDRGLSAAVAALCAIIVIIFTTQTTLWNVYFSSAALLTAYALYGLRREGA